MHEDPFRIGIIANGRHAYDLDRDSTDGSLLRQPTAQNRMIIINRRYRIHYLLYTGPYYRSNRDAFLEKGAVNVDNN